LLARNIKAIIATVAKFILRQFNLSSFVNLICLRRGFHPTQRTQRKERNEMTSLLNRPIAAASDEGVCRWHAAKLWQTHAIKYESIGIKFDLHHRLHNK